METAAKGTRRITKERHKQVTWTGVCPSCTNFRIVTVPRFNRDALDRTAKYGGSYLCCGGENGHRCWHMTKSENAKNLYETFGSEPSPRVEEAR